MRDRASKGIAPPPFTILRLAWADEQLGAIDLPKATMRVRGSCGSGLARSASDPPGVFWAVGDRGPNVKPKILARHYGVEGMDAIARLPGAKIMPRPDLGPAIARLQVHDDRVELLQAWPLADAVGTPISGLAPPDAPDARAEPLFDLDGNSLPPDPCGLDTEGIVALANGDLLLGDEFGPSLVRVDRQGRVLARYTPGNIAIADARYPVEPLLPDIASRRQLNRGFEALAISPDQAWLTLAFQSPLAHPDEAAHRAARHVRLWQLDAASLEVVAQYLYPLDPPESFMRDAAKGPVDLSDLKVSELVALDDGRLLVLERGSQTTKIYRVALDAALALGREHLDLAHRPTAEELSAQGAPLPELRKQLLFTSDAAPELAADMEGMLLLSPTELLLVNDNDFGVEGAETCFYRISFEEPI